MSGSGPKRFEYDFNTKKWLEVEEQDGVKNTRRVNDDINSLLAKEMKSLFGVDMHFWDVCCVFFIDCAMWRISRQPNYTLKERWTTKLIPLKR